MSELENELAGKEYFVKFTLVTDVEGEYNVEMQSSLPTDRDSATAFLDMLSQLNTGEYSNMMLENITLESNIERNVLFQEISTNWHREIAERKAQNSANSVVSPLRVFGGSNL